jgi:UTP--glucose-1-phosphate uridylyltransferase
MKGLGDAILLSEEWLQGRPALVAFGDCVIETPGDIPASRLIMAHLESGAGATVLTQRVPPESTRKYGIMKPLADADLDFPFPLEDIVEKPQPEDAPSNIAVAGRWILEPSVLELLKRTPAGPDGELSLTDAIRLGLNEGLVVWATPLREGEARRDIGGWETYLSAVADCAARDEEFGEKVRAKLCGGG